jgi:hypothetical protein
MPTDKGADRDIRECWRFKPGPVWTEGSAWCILWLLDTILWSEQQFFFALLQQQLFSSCWPNATENTSSPQKWILAGMAASPERYISRNTMLKNLFKCTKRVTKVLIKK